MVSKSYWVVQSAVVSCNVTANALSEPTVTTVTRGQLPLMEGQPEREAKLAVVAGRWRIVLGSAVWDIDVV